MSEKETPETNDDQAVAVADKPHHHHHDHDHDHDHHHHHEPEFEFVEDPSFAVEYKGDCVYEVGVKIPAANKAKKTGELFDELQGEAQLPGFRRGKAPRTLLEKKFAKAVKGDVAEKLISAAFQKLMIDEKLNPLGPPDFDGLNETLEQEDSADLEFTLKFEVAPRCTLGDYKGLKVERPVLKIADKEVDEAIETMRERFAVYETYTKGKSKDGDQVIIDFKGIIDGEAFAGGSADNYPYIVGSKRFFPEFEAVLVGTKAGEEVTCEVAFPEDYHGKDVAGKTAQFSIKINEVKRKQLPELDDEFAKEAGFESLADMKTKVADDLREGANQQSQRIAENNALKQVVDASTFELPESLVASSAREYYNQEVRRLVSLRIAPADLMARDAEIQAEARKVAEDNIKTFVAINEIGMKEDIEVTEADFEAEAANIMSRTGMDMQVVQRFLAQSEQRSDYEGRIFRQKAVKVVLNAATITEKEVSRDELNKQDEETDEE
ncbi:MAG: trigger factor [Candidatus Hydrogenedens sp.]|nr:trigger factor [Candidatus Hydrogenedens sp.]